MDHATTNSEREIALLQTGTPFAYPKDLPPDLEGEVRQYASEQVHALSQAFIHRLVLTLIKGEDIKTDLITLAYLCGFDMPALIGAKENTMASIAEVLGMSKQGFQQRANKMAKRNGLDYLRCNRGHRKQRGKAC